MLILEVAKLRSERRTLILVMAGKWRNSVFLAAKFVAKCCAEMFVLVLRTFEPPKHLPTTLHRKFHRVSGRNVLVCHSPLRERFREG